MSLPAPSLEDDRAFEQRFARVEALLAELAQASDPMVERNAREVLSSVLELHRRGLARVLEIAAPSASIREALATDPRASALLLLHGLHPIPVAERVERALSAARVSYAAKIESIEAEALSVDAIVVRITAAASACTSTRAAIKKDFEAALSAAVPDVASVQLEIVEPAPALITLRVRPQKEAARAGGETR
jgi:hypothetical protein